MPEVADTRGAIVSQKLPSHRESWILDVRLRIGNEQRTPKGGNGVGIYYLRDIDQSELAEGLFGYTTRFNGLAVVLNGLLNQESDEGVSNTI